MQGEPDDGRGDAELMARVRSVFAGGEESDFGMEQPPAELWDRIEASVAEPQVRRKEPPSRAVGVGTVVEYRIDDDDVVTEVGEQWADFARGNHAPELGVPSSDRTIWSYFGTDEIREVWQLFVDRVRATGTAAVVPLRCDAPDVRRWFEMSVVPDEDGGVHFRSVLVFEESRPPVGVLDPSVQRDDGLPPIALCSWCGQGWHGEHWLDIEELVRAARLLERASPPPIVYGICDPCRHDMSADLVVPGAEPTTT